MAPYLFRRLSAKAASLSACALVAASLAFGLPVQAQAHGPASVADLAEQLADSVVNISTAQTVQGRRSVPMPQVPDGSPFQEFFEEFFNRQNRDEDQPRRVQSLGSGFVIDGTEGIIITNNHVIEGADEITANFNDGTKLRAEIIGTDEKTDIAVLKVEPITPLNEVAFGDSNAIRVGDWVMAIGNPFGLGGTVTVGIVSARNRDINSGPYDNFIQTDASINRGNSGGPLFDMKGNVVGINTAIISPSGGSIGIGFAIPAETATRVIAQLREFGETRRGWLGVRISEVNDETAEGLGLDEAKGALVAGVTEGGPADKAELKAGDVILKFDGKDVPVMRELPRMVAETAIGKEVEVVVLRSGEELSVQVVLERLEENEEVAASTPVPGDNGGAPGEAQKQQPSDSTQVLGLTLAALDDNLRTEFAIDDAVDGVVIVEVEPGSDAEAKRIVAGDVIREIDQEPVKTVADVEAVIDRLTADGHRSALFLLSNPSGDVRFIPVRLESQ